MTLEMFVVDCVDDSVTHAEAAYAGLDTADEGKLPSQRTPVSSAFPASSAYAAVLKSRENCPRVNVRVTPLPKHPEAVRRTRGYQAKTQMLRELREAERQAKDRDNERKDR